MSVAAVAGILAQTPAGALIDRTLAKRAVVAAAALIVTAGSLMLLFVGSFWLVAATQAATGVAAAVYLRDLLARAGFRPGSHVVTHCDGGERALLAAAAARAGYDDVRAYYLSFADWAKDESCPIVRD